MFPTTGRVRDHHTGNFFHQCVGSLCLTQMLRDSHNICRCYQSSLFIPVWRNLECRSKQGFKPVTFRAVDCCSFKWTDRSALYKPSFGCSARETPLRCSLFSFFNFIQTFFTFDLCLYIVFSCYFRSLISRGNYTIIFTKAFSLKSLLKHSWKNFLLWLTHNRVNRESTYLFIYYASDIITFSKRICNEAHDKEKKTKNRIGIC